MRTLYYFPVLHNGPERGHKPSPGTESFWTMVEELVDSIWSSSTTVRVYQDTLFFSVHEEKGLDLMREFAKVGSRQFRLALRLMERDAILEVSEDPHLMATCNSTCSLEPRDAFVAERINETLRDGEVGIIFMGVDHRTIERCLDSDINVVYPITQPYLDILQKHLRDTYDIGLWNIERVLRRAPL